MNVFEFQKIIKTVELAFDRQLKPDQSDFWLQRFEKWTAKKFQWAIDRIVDENDRFPSVASVFKKGQEYREEIAEGRKSACSFCDSYGFVEVLEQVDIGLYRKQYRCPDCDNGAVTIPSSKAVRYSKLDEDRGCILSWHYHGRVSSRYGALKCEPINNHRPEKRPIDFKAIVKSVSSEELPGKEFERKKSLSADFERELFA